jgi:hypothetical protein
MEVYAGKKKKEGEGITKSNGGLTSRWDGETGSRERGLCFKVF